MNHYARWLVGVECGFETALVSIEKSHFLRYKSQTCQARRIAFESSHVIASEYEILGQCTTENTRCACKQYMFCVGNYDVF